MPDFVRNAYFQIWHVLQDIEEATPLLERYVSMSGPEESVFPPIVAVLDKLHMFYGKVKEEQVQAKLQEVQAEEAKRKVQAEVQVVKAEEARARVQGGQAKDFTNFRPKWGSFYPTVNYAPLPEVRSSLYFPCNCQQTFS
jgi:uncharacterized protein YPO0396